MQRILAACGVLGLFGVMFALPLYVALTLCAMPCCHHGGGVAMTSDMTGCATTPCSIRSDEVSAPATTTSHARTDAVAAPIATVERGAHRQCPRSDSGGVAAAVHIAVPSSVLRI
jgi:hypothetical protein